MTDLTLYDIGAEWEAIESELFESGGELTPEMEERLDELFGQEGEKIDGYLAVRANMKMMEEGAKAEAARLSAKARAAANTITKLEERLAYHMERTGKDVIERPLGKIRLQESRAVVLTVDEGELPQDYLRTKTVVTVNKSFLKECLSSTVDEVKEQAGKFAHFASTKYIRVY